MVQKNVVQDQGSKKILVQKNFASKKILGQKNLGSKKIRDQKNFGSKKIWIQKFLEIRSGSKNWSKQNLGPTFKVWSKLSQ